MQCSWGCILEQPHWNIPDPRQQPAAVVLASHLYCFRCHKSSSQLSIFHVNQWLIAMKINTKIHGYVRLTNCTCKPSLHFGHFVVSQQSHGWNNVISHPRNDPHTQLFDALRTSASTEEYFTRKWPPTMPLDGFLSICQPVRNNLMHASH